MTDTETKFFEKQKNLTVLATLTKLYIFFKIQNWSRLCTIKLFSLYAACDS